MNVNTSVSGVRNRGAPQDSSQTQFGTVSDDQDFSNYFDFDTQGSEYEFSDFSSQNSSSRAFFESQPASQDTMPEISTNLRYEDGFEEFNAKELPEHACRYIID